MDGWISGLIGNPVYQIFFDFSMNKFGCYIGLISGDAALERKDNQQVSFFLVTMSILSAVKGVGKSPMHGCTLALCRSKPVDVKDADVVLEDESQGDDSDEPRSRFAHLHDTVLLKASLYAPVSSLLRPDLPVHLLIF